MPVRSGQALAVIETSYRFTHGTSEWLSGVLQSIAGVLRCELRGFAGLYDATAPNWVDVKDFVNHGFPAEFLYEAFHQDPTSEEQSRRIVRLFRGGAYGSVMDQVAPFMPQYAEMFRRYAMEDALIVIPADPSAKSCFFGLQMPRSSVTPRTRYFWRKVMAHLAAGMRLRQHLAERLAIEPEPTRHADAILSSAGKVEHATGDAAEPEAREALMAALVRIDAARGVRANSDAERAVELWHGLVAGRWSLVEHFERDGRRYFLAYRNEPEVARLQALTPREVQVWSYEAMGRTNKLIAYSLGLSEATVVRALRSARQKLGGKGTLEALHALRTCERAEVFEPGIETPSAPPRLEGRSK